MKLHRNLMDETRASFLYEFLELLCHQYSAEFCLPIAPMDIFSGGFHDFINSLLLNFNIVSV